MAQPMIIAGNAAIAGKLSEMAEVLSRQEADRYRVSAYRRAARQIATYPKPLEEIVRAAGLDGVVELPGIGRSIGAAIVEMVTTGRWAALDRLTGMLAPQALFQTIPGIGPDLAVRIHDALHVDTLEALELAAHDGRLAEVPGIGMRRAAAIRAALGERLGARHIRRNPSEPPPPVALLLDVDREYRRKAAAGALPTIAPKRFNPSGEAWLPVLHVRRDGWDVTALFSNTERAHALGKTRDWVVLYFHHDEAPEAQCTIVTETHGALAGRRVVRGREGDCADHFAGSGPAEARPKPGP